MNFNFNKSNKSTIDLNKILEEVGGIETSIGKNVSRKIDEIEAEELKRSFIKRSFILNNKENNTEKKEKLEDLEDNEFKKIKDSVFIDYNKNIEDKINEISLRYKIIIKKSDFDCFFDDNFFLNIKNINLGLKVDKINLSHVLLRKILIENKKIHGLDFTKNPFKNISYLNNIIFEVLLKNDSIKKIKLDLTDATDKDIDDLIAIYQKTGFNGFLIQIDSDNVKNIKKIKNEITPNVLIVKNPKKEKISEIQSSLKQIIEKKKIEAEKLNDYEKINSNFSAFEFSLFLFKQRLKNLPKEKAEDYKKYLKDVFKLPKKDRREFYINEIRLAFNGIVVHKKIDLDAKGILFLSKIAGLNFSDFNYEKYNLKGEDLTENGSIKYENNSVNYINNDGTINKDILFNLPKTLVSDLSQTDGLNVFKTKGQRFDSDYFMSTLDHHGENSKKGNSSAIQMFQLLLRLGLIKDVEKIKKSNQEEYLKISKEEKQNFYFLKEIVNFINREDDKCYNFNKYDKNIKITEKMFLNSYKTIYGYSKFINPNNLEKIYNCKTLKEKYFKNNPLLPLEFIELTDDELKEIGILSKKNIVKNIVNKLKLDFHKYNNKENVKESKYGKIFIQRDFKFISNPTDIILCNNFAGFIEYSNEGKNFFISLFGDNYPEFSDELNKKLENNGVKRIRGMLIKIDKEKTINEELFDEILNELEINKKQENSKNIEEFENNLNNKDKTKEVKENNVLKKIDIPYLDNSIGQVDFLNDQESLEQYSKDCINEISKYSFNNVNGFKNFFNRLENISGDISIFRENIQTFMLLSSSELFQPVKFLNLDNKDFYFSSLLRENGKNDKILCFVDDGKNIYSRLFSVSETWKNKFRSYFFLNSGFYGNEFLKNTNNDIFLEKDNITSIAKINPKIQDTIKEIIEKDKKIIKINEELGDVIANGFSLIDANKQNPYSFYSYTAPKEIKVEKIDGLNFFDGHKILSDSLKRIDNIGIINYIQELKKNIFNILKLNEIKIPSELVPNFKNNFLKRDVLDNIYYGKVVLETYSCSLKNRPVEIDFITNNDENVWVDEIRYVDSNITTYSTNKDVIQADILTNFPVTNKKDNLILNLLAYINSKLKKIHLMSCNELVTNFEFKEEIKPEKFSKKYFKKHFESINNEFKELLLNVLKDIKYNSDNDYIDMVKFFGDLEIIKKYKETDNYKKNIEFLSEEKKYQNNYLQFNNLDSLLEKHSLSTEK